MTFLTDEQIDNAMFAANVQGYSYTDDPAGYRAVVRSLLAAAAPYPTRECAAEALTPSVGAPQAVEQAHGCASCGNCIGHDLDCPSHPANRSDAWSAAQPQAVAEQGDLPPPVLMVKVFRRGRIEQYPPTENYYTEEHMRAAMGAAPAAPVAEPAEKPWHQVATVTMDGHQLREALNFINPDGDADPDQLDDELTFGVVRHKDDDGVESTGLCCWNDDTDGVYPLDRGGAYTSVAVEPAAQPQPVAEQGELPPLTMSVYGTRTELELERARRAAVAASQQASEPVATYIGVTYGAAHVIEWTDDKSLPVGTKLYAAPAIQQPQDAEDTARLDFMTSDKCIMDCSGSPDDKRYWLSWPYLYEEQGETYATPREAIDAARAALAKKGGA